MLKTREEIASFEEKGERPNVNVEMAAILRGYSITIYAPVQLLRIPAF